MLYHVRMTVCVTWGSRATQCEQVIVVENLLIGDELRTDLDSIRQHIERVGAEEVVCILTTTSCFAPRSADSIVEVAKLCAVADVGHVVNNAYGVQVEATLAKLQRSLASSASALLRVHDGVPLTVCRAVRASHLRVAEGPRRRRCAEHRQELYGAIDPGGVVVLLQRQRLVTF